MRLLTLIFVPILIVCCFTASAIDKPLFNPTYPRIMAMAIKSPTKYDNVAYQKRLARSDVLVLNFWPGWKEYKYGQNAMRSVVLNIKKYNPNILVGQYTILGEAKDQNNRDMTSMDIAKKLDQEDWWLRSFGGSKVRWTDQYMAWDINITDYSKRDVNGMRYPQWLAQRNYHTFFKRNSELDFWYMDNSLSVSPVKLADWTCDGIPRVSAMKEYAQAYRIGHVNYWNAVFALQPETILIVNSNDISNSEYRDRVHGVFLEAIFGRSWSLDSRVGWSGVLEQYYKTMRDVLSPRVVTINAWGKSTDYRLLRFTLATSLLNDGYYSFTDEEIGYSDLPWFDEFDIDLGYPVEIPPVTSWKDGVYKRVFEKGMVLVNPGVKSVSVSLPSGYSTFEGKQDPKINNGRVVNNIVISPRDGILLVRRN